MIYYSVIQFDWFLTNKIVFEQEKIELKWLLIDLDSLLSLIDS